MPVSIEKTDGKYRVSTPGGVKAKHTTKGKAEAQGRLLRGVEHGWKPTGKPARESMEDMQNSVKPLAFQVVEDMLNSED